MWTDVFIRRPVLAVVVSLFILLFGVVSLPRLGVQETPDVESPTVTVSTIWFGADPAVMETEVTEVLERELNGIEGLELIRSESRDQVSQITLEFSLERDLEDAANDVRDRVSRARGDLPDDTQDPVVEKADSDAQPVIYIRLLGDRSLLDLSDIADRLVRERLQTVPGVSAVHLYGERRYAMRVELDLARMAARDVTVADLQAAFDAQNVDAPAGRVEGEATDLAMRVDAGLDTPEAFSRMVVAVRDGAEVRLGDVAFVRLGAEDERSAARSEASPSVTLAVVPQSGANIIAISDEVRRRLPGIQADLPESVDLAINYDRSLPVRAGIKDVAVTLGLSTLAVVLIIGAFLRNLRATVIPATAIVVSIVGTFAFFDAAGFTINVFTLFGLVLAIGIVVDDAIVVLENVWRRIEDGQAPFEAAIQGTREIVFPVLATTLSLLAVFLPVIFAGGTSGRLFLEFGATIAVAVALSTVVALTLTPTLCALLLRPTGARSEASSVGAMQRGFDRTLRPFLARPWIAGTLVVASLLGGWWAMSSAPREFFPIEDRSFFIVRTIAPEGVGFAWMDARMQEVEGDLMAAVPERTGMMTRVSTGRGGLPGSANSGMFGFPLVPPGERDRSQGDIVQAVRQVLSDVTAFRAIPIQFPTVGRGFGSPLQVAVLFDDFDTLVERLPELHRIARDVPGLSAVDFDLKLDRPEVRVVVDREKAATLGVSLREVARTLQVLSTGLEMSRFKLRARQYDVMVGLAPRDRTTSDLLGQIPVRTISGATVPLGNLVRFEEQSAASSRYHVDRAASVTVSANLDGIALGEAIDRFERALEEGLGSGYRTVLLGQSKELADASGTLGLVFALAVTLVFLVLAAQFDSFRDPLPILVSLPVAVAAGVGALVLAGESLTFFAQVGLVLLVGLVTKNGILIVEFARQVQADEGLDLHEAARRAAILRLRPILMTATSTVGGAIPIALGLSGESRTGLGIVVCAGMAAATALSLYVTPVVWMAFARIRWRRTAAAAVATSALLLALPVRAQEVLDLGATLRLADADNPSLEAARADALAARRAVGVARGLLLPNVSASGRYQYGNTFVAGGAGVGGDPTSFANLSGTLGVPLLDAAGWGFVGATARRAEASAADTLATRVDVLRAAGEAFVALQAAEARRAVTLDTLERSRELLEVAEDRVEAGVAIPLDATRARVAVRQDELAVVQAERDVRAAEANLKALLGRPGAEIEATPLAILPRPEALDEVVLPRVEAARAFARAARADQRLGRLRFAPQLGAFATAGTLTRFSDQGWLPTTAAGLEVVWFPVDASLIADLGRLGALRAAADARVGAAVADASAEVATADAELRAAASGLELADDALALAEAELEQAVDVYTAGLGDNVAVVEAQIRRAELALGRVDAVAAWNRAVLRWYASRGTLAPLLR